MYVSTQNGCSPPTFRIETESRNTWANSEQTMVVMASDGPSRKRKRPTDDVTMSRVHVCWGQSFLLKIDSGFKFPCIFWITCMWCEEASKRWKREWTSNDVTKSGVHVRREQSVLLTIDSGFPCVFWITWIWWERESKRWKRKRPTNDVTKSGVHVRWGQSFLLLEIDRGFPCVWKRESNDGRKKDQGMAWLSLMVIPCYFRYGGWKKNDGIHMY